MHYTKNREKFIFFIPAILKIWFFSIFATAFGQKRMSGSVIGNTSDFGSEESRFEPWPDNEKAALDKAAFFILLLVFRLELIPYIC